jgi:hypothetical protein
LKLLKTSDTIVQFDTILTAPLRAVERTIRVREELPLVAVRCVLGDAEAARNLENSAVLAEERALGERTPHTIGELRAAVDVGAGQKEEELLAAPATCKV